MTSMSRYEVLVASTAPGLQTRLSSAKTACFTAMSSNTASTTTSAWLQCVVGGGAAEARHHRGLGLGAEAALGDQAVVDLRRWRGRGRGFPRRARSSSPSCRRRASPPQCRRPSCRRRRRRPRSAAAAAPPSSRAPWRPRARRRTHGSGRRAAGCRYTAGTACAPGAGLHRKGRSSAASTASTILWAKTGRGSGSDVGARSVERGAARGSAIGQSLRVARGAPARRRQAAPAHRPGGEGVVAAAEPVHETERQCLFSADVAAAQHQLERRAMPIRRGARCACRRRRHQAELHFGQTELDAVHGQPVMRRQRHLQAATERRAVQGGDHRLAAGLDPVADLGQRRRPRRLPEFADVGAGDEVASGTDDQHRGDRCPPARRRSPTPARGGRPRQLR